jgi:hypothetical protein
MNPNNGKQEKPKKKSFHDLYIIRGGTIMNKKNWKNQENAQKMVCL